jgi:hypothetical protein
LRTSDLWHQWTYSTEFPIQFYRYCVSGSVNVPSL